MSQTIVLAEDDEDISEIIRAALQDSDFTVVLARNGEEAMGHLQTKSVDLLITDVRMPICDGAVLTRLAKGFRPHMPVIIITGHSDFDEDEAKILGADAFLRKPFDTRRLVALVKSQAALRKAS